MISFKTAQVSALALLLGLTTVQPTLARPNQVYGDQVNDYNYQSGVIDPGTRIPVSYKEQRLELEPGETISLRLTVTQTIRDRNGSVLIPVGSQIEGQLEPAGRGVRYVAREIKINGSQAIPLEATSAIVGRSETVKIGANTADIIKGTLSGAGAATIIAGTTGDRRIDPLEVLAGAAVGTLAGWGLPEAGIVGGGTKEIISLNPNRDLNLTLQSPLYLGNDRRPSYENYPNRYPQTRPTTNSRQGNEFRW